MPTPKIPPRPRTLVVHKRSALEEYRRADTRAGHDETDDLLEAGNEAVARLRPSQTTTAPQRPGELGTAATLGGGAPLGSPRDVRGLGPRAAVLCFLDAEVRRKRRRALPVAEVHRRLLEVQ